MRGLTLTAVSAVFWTLRVAFGAEVRAATEADVSVPPQGYIIFGGQIEPGDNDRLIKVIKGVPPDLAPTLLLTSNGGNLLESFKIADTLKRNKVAIRLNWNSVCYSACFTLLPAAQSFVAYSTTRVGVHGASAPTGEALDSVTIAMVHIYHEMGVPPAILGKMAATSSSEITLLDEVDLRDLRGVIYDLNSDDVAVLIMTDPRSPEWRGSTIDPISRFGCFTTLQPVIFWTRHANIPTHHCTEDQVNIILSEISAVIPNLGSKQFFRWVDQTHPG